MNTNPLKSLSARNVTRFGMQVTLCAASLFSAVGANAAPEAAFNIRTSSNGMTYEVPAPENLVGRCEESGAPDGKMSQHAWGLVFECTYTAVDGATLESSAKPALDAMRRQYNHSITNEVDFSKSDSVGQSLGFEVKMSQRKPTHRIQQEGRSAYGVNSVILQIRISCLKEQANCNEAVVAEHAKSLGQRTGPFRGVVKQNRSIPTVRDPGLSQANVSGPAIEPLVFVRFVDGYGQPQSGLVRASDAGRYGGGEATVIITRNNSYGNGSVTSVVPVSQAGGIGVPAFVVRQDTYGNGPTDFVVPADSLSQGISNAVCSLGTTGGAQTCSR